ncbi:hypothetical protein [Streptomyces chartreusis]|uniref:hypothetical protein n=1 Tax=Streptomyces chartreusis TaxID=1969 RepID=UPI002E8059D0|nr:hypothetical protein [Streptomyces chartreusis]WUB23228.1 hypothetical protein OG997_43970 [Streptomyces chartreusis]
MSTSFPFLQDWMDKASQGHPLRDYFDLASGNGGTDSVASAIVTAFENIIEVLEKAKPERLAGVRRDFRQAADTDALLIPRAEMVAGAKLARAGIPFDFGRRNGATEPDLMLRDMNLAIEVKARRLDGLQDLRDELQTALADVTPTVLVELRTDSQPLVIKKSVRDKVVEETVQRARGQNYGTAVTTVDQPWSARKRLLIHVGLYQAADLMDGSRIIVTGGFWGAEPGPHMMDVEDQVMAVLEDKQKLRQANTRPTILLFDAARTGMAWIRSELVWAQRLAMRLPDTTPFVAAAVMTPKLDDPDVGISLGVRENLSTQDRAAVDELAHRVGLTGV